ncbi:MAG: hypothetical protein ABF271_15110 [Abyssibacter sp.]|uniref:hypothetical protein n=1 Tax=Abyssibacter sp. TaxID=2320200 RepID=UPI002EA16C00|nr:hypothetical protein [Pseudomonadota bacterium]
MSKLSEQSAGNQRMEAGMFYPTGYMVVGFDHTGDASAAHDYLRNAGFEPDDITIVPAEQMRREAEANLSNPGLFASIGASLPVREKQLDLARRGCEFVLVNAPTDHAETRAKKALAQLPVRYAVKYRHLVIEDMRNQIESTQPHSDAARGA